MTDLSADLVQQKQRLREKLRFRRKHFAANLDGMAPLAAFRALPAPLCERLADHAMVGAYAARAAEPDILPMFAGAGEPGARARPPHAGRIEHRELRRWRLGGPVEGGPWGQIGSAAGRGKAGQHW